MNPAGYAQAPGAFRNHWSLRNFRFRWSSWIAVALLFAPVLWLGITFADAHLALKGLMVVMALVAVAPLVRDFTRSQCRQCGAQAEPITLRDAGGAERTARACHRCRIVDAL